MSVDCYGFHAPSGGGSYNLVLVDFAATVTLSSAITTTDFRMFAGSTSQTADDRDITVTSYFRWTGGTINSSAFVGKLNIDGAVGLIEPGGGTVTTGDTIQFLNGATGTFYDGTVNFTGGEGISVGGGCEANFEIGTAGINLDYSGPIPSQGKIILQAGATGTFYRKAGITGLTSGNIDMPIVITGGIFTVHENVNLPMFGGQ